MTVELTVDDRNRWNTAIQERVLFTSSDTSEAVYAAYELFCKDKGIPHIVLHESGDMTVSTWFVEPPPSMVTIFEVMEALEEIGAVQHLNQRDSESVQVLIGVIVATEADPDHVAEILERVLELLGQFKSEEAA